MTRSPLGQLAALGILAGLLLTGATFALLRSLAESSGGELRRAMALFIAQVIEKGPYEQTVLQFERFRAKSGAPVTHIWIVSDRGEVLETNSRRTLPVACEEAGAKPSAVHEMLVDYRLLQLVPDSVIVRLAAQEPRFLCVRLERGATSGWPHVARVVLPLLAVLSSALLSVLFCFLYLRRKSREATKVLARLGRGELGARFRVRQFDAIGKLMLDFNRMGDEIERLITRLHLVERSRVDVLQQLSHDLRTPLMSLRLAADVLADEGQPLSTPDRAELINVVRTELAYFSHLLDELFFIARLDEAPALPRRERIELGPLLRTEIDAARRRAEASGRKLEWAFRDEHVSDAFLEGDPALLRRLLRNALDNAARFAARDVELSVGAEQDRWVIALKDDGPGMTSEQIAQFGRPRQTRVLAPNDAMQVSLGLGSVVMASILALHGGGWQISSPVTDAKDAPGLVLRLTLPRPQP